MENPRIELFALCRSLRNRQIDEEDYSSSPELTIEQNESKEDLILKPMLREGRHVMKCTVVNPDHNRRTVIERVFTVHSLSQPSRRDVNLNLESLSHSVLEGRNLQERTPSMMTSYGLEYTTSLKTKLIMSTDWSHLMLVLNPIIICIIILFYCCCRQIGSSILQRRNATTIPSSANWFFVTDRALKYAALNKALDFLPSWLRALLVRLFLFTSDNLVVYGVLSSIALHLFLPAFFKDAHVCCFRFFVIVG